MYTQLSMISRVSTKKLLTSASSCIISFVIGGNISVALENCIFVITLSVNILIEIEEADVV